MGDLKREQRKPGEGVGGRDPGDAADLWVGGVCVHTCGGSLPGSLPSPTRSQPRTRSAACWARVVPGALAGLPPPALTPNLVGSHRLPFTAYNRPPPNLGKSKSGAKATVGPVQALWDPAQLSSAVQFLVGIFRKGRCVEVRRLGSDLL